MLPHTTTMRLGRFAILSLFFDPVLVKINSFGKGKAFESPTPINPEVKEELELVALAPARLLDRAQVRRLWPPCGSWSTVLCARDVELRDPHHLDP